jgi:hypothetical protein
MKNGGRIGYEERWEERDWFDWWDHRRYFGNVWLWIRCFGVFSGFFFFLFVTRFAEFVLVR